MFGLHGVPPLQITRCTSPVNRAKEEPRIANQVNAHNVTALRSLAQSWHRLLVSERNLRYQILTYSL